MSETFWKPWDSLPTWINIHSYCFTPYAMVQFLANWGMASLAFLNVWCVLVSNCYTFNMAHQLNHNTHIQWSSLLMIMILIVMLLILISASWVKASFKLGLGFQSHYSLNNNITTQQKPLENPSFFPFHKQMKWQVTILLSPKTCKYTPWQK